MYRSYENPYEVQKMLDEAQEQYDKAVAEGADVDDLIYMAEDIAELKQRLNHAWQDDEYDMDQSERDFDY